MMRQNLRWAPIPSTLLNIAASLDSGQCFRWITAGNGDRLGVIGPSAVLLRPEENGFWWRTFPESDRWDLLARYFALDMDLERLYTDWREAEPRIERSIEANSGLRILRQDAEEAFFSFLCASCNTVTKIRRSVQALARIYGEPLATIDGHALYRFPRAAEIASASETALRAEIWGYRAPRLIEAARIVHARGDSWLEDLRAASYSEAHAELTAIPGIGAKIADCICLFALWHDQAVPIDTHVRRIATRWYRPDLATKSLTPNVYRTLSGVFRERFGSYAGWAQQYLFFDELNNTEIEDV
jgi:N-glycosylase/DNA lyase